MTLQPIPEAQGGHTRGAAPRADAAGLGQPHSIFLNGAYTANVKELAPITRRSTQVETVLIARIDGVADVVLQDGRALTMNGLFTQPRTLLSSPIAEQLRCALEDGTMGLFIQVAEGKATSVPNVFACGDAARAAGNLTLAVADGATAGIGGASGRRWGDV